MGMGWDGWGGSRLNWDDGENQPMLRRRLLVCLRVGCLT
jgi:hypothetical protein